MSKTKNTRFSVAVLLAFSCCFVSTCKATSVVILVSRHGIVLGADGKATFTATGQKQRISGATTHQKIFFLNRSIAIAHAGFEAMRISAVGGKHLQTAREYFSVGQFIQDVQKRTSPVFTTSKVADILKDVLTNKFSDLDLMLKSGSIKREDIPAPHDVLTQFYVAGYEGQSARVYNVLVEIDWRTLTHNIPVVTLYPGQRRNLSFNWIGGRERGIIELVDQNSAVLKQAVSAMPEEMTALQGDLDLDVPRMLTLAYGLLVIEVRRNPQSVGFPLTIATVTPDQRVDIQTYKQ